MKKIINHRPIVFNLIILIIGILCAYYEIFNNTLMHVLLIGLCIILIICRFFLTYKKGKAWLFIVLSVLIFLSGFFTTNVTINNFLKYDLPNQSYVVSGRVQSVSEYDNGSSLIIDDVILDGSISAKLPYKVAVTVYGEQKFSLGDVITFDSELNEISIIRNNRFSSFYVDEGIRFNCVNNSEDVSVINGSPNIFERTNILIKNCLKDNLDSDEFATAYALICGNSEYMDEVILTNYRNAGVAHIFAVSGLHIGFLALVLDFVLSKLRVNKYVKFFVVGIVLFFYSGVCSFSASSIRATIMTISLMLSKILGKKYDALSSVSFAGILILLFSPIELFKAGFELSFVVVFGIIILSKPLSKIFKFLPRKLAISLGTVLSAQLFSLPVCLFQFGELSLASVFTNLIFVPIVGVIYILLFSLTLLSLILNIGQFVLVPINYIFKAVNFVISVIDFEIFVVTFASIGVFFITYYLTLLVSSPLVNLKRISKTILCICLCLITVIGSFYVNKSKNDRVRVSVCGSKTICATLVGVNSVNILIVSEFNSVFYSNRVAMLLSEQKIDSLDAVIVFDTDNINTECVASKLSHFCRIKSVYTRGEFYDFLALKKSFPDIEFIDLYNRTGIDFDGIDVKFFEEYGVTVNAKDKRVLITSMVEDNKSKTNLFVGEYDLAVVFDEQDYIKEKIITNNFISYKRYGNMVNAEQNGNLLFWF